MHKVRVFSELVYDTDRNLTNVLIDKDWNLYMIDFSRAFRLRDELKSPQNLVKCDRRLFDRLQQLSEEDIVRVTRGHLTKSEIKALMERRKKIVSFFQKLIAEKGDNEVLYD